MSLLSESEASQWQGDSFSLTSQALWHSSSSFALTQPREHSSFDNLWGLSMLRILGEAGTSDHNTKRPRRHSLLFFGPCDDPPRRRPRTLETSLPTVGAMVTSHKQSNHTKIGMTQTRAAVNLRRSRTQQVPRASSLRAPH